MWQRLFIILGVFFLVLILLGIGVFAYLSIAKPFGIEPANVPAAIFQAQEDTQSSYDHPALSEQQEIFLENIGVDTTQIPTRISAEQEACAVEKLGQERVDEILDGASLRTSDYVKAGGCF